MIFLSFHRSLSLFSSSTKKTCLKSHCMGGQSQMWLKDNFTTAMYKTVYGFIWYKQLS